MIGCLEGFFAVSLCCSDASSGARIAVCELLFLTLSYS